jgi:hypothetical protein
MQNKMIKTLNTQQELLYNARHVVTTLLSRLSMCHDEKDIKAMEKLAAILYKIVTTMGKLTDLEHQTATLYSEYNITQEAPDAKDLTRMDCEMIISIAREWGLIKDDYCSNQIEKILNKYEEEGGVHNV